MCMGMKVCIARKALRILFTVEQSTSLVPSPITMFGIDRARTNSVDFSNVYFQIDWFFRPKSIIPINSNFPISLLYNTFVLVVRFAPALATIYIVFDCFFSVYSSVYLLVRLFSVWNQTTTTMHTQYIFQILITIFVNIALDGIVSILWKLVVRCTVQNVLSQRKFVLLHLFKWNIWTLSIFQ